MAEEQQQPKEKFRSTLLVEGADDQHVVFHLCQKYELPENFEVFDCKGYSKLQSQISKRLKNNSTEIDTLGIVVDADLNLQKRWQELRKILNTFGYNIADNEFNINGLTIEKDEENELPRLGIWIMPDNNTKGILEDFISTLVPQGDQLWPESERILSEIELKNLQKYKTADRSKALIHTWLAWQSDPGITFGNAITRTFLTTDSALCQQFVNWLERLFNDSQN